MCCGAKSRRNQVRVSGQPARVADSSALQSVASTKPSAVQFEYVGKTRMTVISPHTGIRYHFGAPGAQVTVDAPDQAMMLHVPDLRPVRFKKD